MDYQAQLEGLMDEHQTKLQELAETYRQEVLIPLCRDHQMEFTQGMGTWFFSPAVEGPTYSLRNYAFTYVDDIRDIEELTQAVIADLEEEGTAVPAHLYRLVDLSAFHEPLEFLHLEYEYNQSFGFLVDDIRAGRDY